MHVPKAPHSWRVSPKRAVQIQRELADRVRIEPLARQCNYVAGTDLAFEDSGLVCIAGVVLWDVKRKQVVEQHVIRRKVGFPYVPGLLSFREAPAILAVLRKLRRAPDLVMCDGHGLAHPRRFGIACHVGVIIDRPTIGCAKSRLIGEHREPGLRRGRRTTLYDRGDKIGAVLRTRDNVRSVYVSVGHRVELATATRLVLACSIGRRLPEPTRLADKRVAAEKMR